MAQFKAINPAVEVNGQTVLSVVNALGAVRQIGLKILTENGISNPIPNQWYSQQKWLNAFKALSENVGPMTLYNIGKFIPQSADFPPEINDVYTALSAIDIAYHMNHRLNNTPMFDPKTGKLSEGIGHYNFKKIADNKIEILCDNPYPCDFDKGIIEAMALRFKPAGKVLKIEHDQTKNCRKVGSNACTYTVSW